MSATGYEETELNYAATEDMEDEQGAEEEDEEEEIDEDEDETSKGKVSWDSSMRWIFTIILSRMKDENLDFFCRKLADVGRISSIEHNATPCEGS
jgi:hypothetical protein